MCGICGTVGRADARELSIMADSMAHRGPDGRGVQTFEEGDLVAGLGHRRLSILDTSEAGAQPMVFADRWWITYNGEIYNYPQLKQELEAKGETFHTRCDTEVLLRMFALEGADMLKRLNGIFALAIWDDRDKRLFVARDRLGVKPLYYVDQPGVYGFASELRCLLPLLDQVELDLEGLVDYLTFLWVPDPKTAFKDVFKLPAGHYAWVDGRGAQTHRYYDVQFAPEGGSAGDWSEQVADTISSAVRRQLLSDVPVGAFLSGGIDSSAIVAAMVGQGSRPKTYTIGFEKEDLREEIIPDDVGHARTVAKAFSTEHREIMTQADVLDLLPKAVWHLEEPVADTAPISTFLICREAGKEMPVMLSGVGGDEVFAGYPRHLAWKISRLLDRLPDPVLGGLEKAAAPIGRPGPAGRLRGPRRNLWKYLRGAGLDPMERYLSYLTYYPDHEMRSVLSDDVRAETADHDPRARHRRHIEAARDYDELATLLYLDAKTFLPNLNLIYTDKMSMAASVEVRVPLLDDEVVGLAARIPSNLKLHRQQRKYIFKKSQEGRLPKDVIWRPKAGFGLPVRSWLVKELSPMIADLLSEETMRARGLLNPATVARLQRENIAGEADYSLQVYTLLNLELWCRQWIDEPWTFERLERESSQVELVR
jgi:asparagine synthase (glutamine-hydrolysing)